MFYIECHMQDRSGTVEPLVGERWSVGRRADNDVVVQDPYASGYHGVLTRRRAGMYYQDVGSRHGSFVRRDGRWVRLEGAYRLDDGDVLLVGRTRLRLVQQAERDEPNEANLETMPGMMTAIGIDGGEMLGNPSGMDTRMLRDLFVLAVALNRAEDVDAVFRQICVCVWGRMSDVVGVQLHLSGGDSERVLAMGRRVQTPPPRVPEPVRVFAESSGQMIAYHPDDVGAAVDRGVRPDQRPILVSPLCVVGHTLGTLSVATSGPSCRPGASHQRALAMISELASAALDRLTIQAQTDLLVDTIALLPVRAVEQIAPETRGHCERVAEMAERLLHFVNQSGRSDWARLALPRTDAARLRVAALLATLHEVCAGTYDGEATLPGAEVEGAAADEPVSGGLLNDVAWPPAVSDMIDAARIAVGFDLVGVSGSEPLSLASTPEIMATFIVAASLCTPRTMDNGPPSPLHPVQSVHRLVSAGRMPAVIHEILVEMLGSAPAPITSNMSVLPAPSWGEDTPMPVNMIPGVEDTNRESEACRVLRPARIARPDSLLSGE